MKSENKIVSYLIITGIMVVTFICAVAINKNVNSNIAWAVLFVINLATLVYILRA